MLDVLAIRFPSVLDQILSCLGAKQRLKIRQVSSILNKYIMTDFRVHRMNRGQLAVVVHRRGNPDLSHGLRMPMVKQRLGWISTLHFFKVDLKTARWTGQLGSLAGQISHLVFEGCTLNSMILFLVLRKCRKLTRLRFSNMRRFFNGYGSLLFSPTQVNVLTSALARVTSLEMYHCGTSASTKFMRQICPNAKMLI